MFILFVVTLLFLSFFSMLPLLLFALCMFIYSLLCFFCLCLSLFFDFLNLFYLFLFLFFWKSHLLNCSSRFVKLFGSIVFFVSFFFWLFFFDGVLSNKIQFTFFFLEAKNYLSNKSLQDLLFLIFCDWIFKRVLSSYFDFLKNPFSKKKNWIFGSSWKILFFFFKKWRNMFYHKSCFCNINIFVQISFCGDLFVFRKISVSPAFSEKVCLYHIFLFFIYN